MNTWQFHLSNWQGVGAVWVISISFVYTRLLVWAFLQWHKLHLTYCLKSSLLLEFFSLFVSMVDQTQMYPSSISPFGLFQGITCNIVWFICLTYLIFILFFCEQKVNGHNYVNVLNPLSTNPTKWSNTFKQFVGKLPTNCLGVFDHFVKLVLKGLKVVSAIFKLVFL